MGLTSRRDSVRLLEVALDAGITHFDVARSYGYGEAESAVGDFLRHRRDEVTVTTKLGIQPPRRTRSITVAKAAARRLGPLISPMRRLARHGGQRLQTTGSFGVDQAAASVETSLRELRTDHIDVLLLHEAGPEDLSDPLLEFLRAKVDEGVIGRFGVASRPDQTRAVLADRPDFAPAVQVANSVRAPVLPTLPDLTDREVYTHSALAGLEELSGMGGQLGNAEHLGPLMIAWALRANQGGTVLFSSRHPARIQANALAGDIDAQAVDRFAELVHPRQGSS